MSDPNTTPPPWAKGEKEIDMFGKGYMLLTNVPANADMEALKKKYLNRFEQVEIIDTAYTISVTGTADRDDRPTGLDVKSSVLPGQVAIYGKGQKRWHGDKEAA